MCEFEGAELTIYTQDGRSVSVPVDAIELTTMLKAIGFTITDDTYSIFGKDTLLKILSGKVNPFRLKEVEDYG